MATPNTVATAVTAVPQPSAPPVIDQAMSTDFALGLNSRGKLESAVKVLNLKIQELFGHCDCMHSSDMNRQKRRGGKNEGEVGADQKDGFWCFEGACS